MATTLVAVGGKGSNPKTTLYVGGLEETVNEATLHAAFIPFGDLKDVNIPLDNTTGKHRGFGFVEFEDKEDAAAAIDNMHNSELFGRVLRVNYAAPVKIKGGDKGWAHQPVWADADKYIEELAAEQELEALDKEQVRARRGRGWRAVVCVWRGRGRLGGRARTRQRLDQGSTAAAPAVRLVCAACFSHHVPAQESPESRQVPVPQAPPLPSPAPCPRPIAFRRRRSGSKRSCSSSWGAARRAARTPWRRWKRRRDRSDEAAAPLAPRARRPDVLSRAAAVVPWRRSACDPLM